MLYKYCCGHCPLLCESSLENFQLEVNLRKSFVLLKHSTLPTLLLSHDNVVTEHLTFFFFGLFFSFGARFLFLTFPIYVFA